MVRNLRDRREGDAAACDDLPPGDYLGGYATQRAAKLAESQVANNCRFEEAKRAEDLFRAKADNLNKFIKQFVDPERRAGLILAIREFGAAWIAHDQHQSGVHSLAVEGVKNRAVLNTARQQKAAKDIAKEEIILEKIAGFFERVKDPAKRTASQISHSILKTVNEGIIQAGMKEKEQYSKDGLRKRVGELMANAEKLEPQ
jgi:hypothetical protein